MDTIKKDQKRSFSNTISAGLKSIGGKGKTFYVVEFKTSTQLHRATTSKEIIVDYIEIGRSPKCQIRFGEDCRLVSGVHCAIIKEGEEYFIKHLSKTNPTLINGKPVADKWYLNSGDEIQLSYGGPILGFIVPKENFTSSIPLTRRLSLFREQAMKPYKKAIAILSVTLFLCIAGFTTYTIVNNKKTENILTKQGEEIKKTQHDLNRQKEINDSLFKANAISETEWKNRNQILTGKITNIEGSIVSSGEIEKLYGSVYYIRLIEIKADIQGKFQTVEDAKGWSGTGFLLTDGRFVTARHLIEGWNYPNNDLDWSLNEIATGGNRVVAYFKAWSPSGSEILFNSEQFDFDKSGDKKKEFTDSTDNSKHTYTETNVIDDWACANSKMKGVLNLNTRLSTSLQVGTQLFTLGFPFGMGALDRDKLSPIYSAFNVSSSGISNGTISISSKSFDHGNSGGPVIVKRNNSYEVVGIVSAGIGSQGLIIPISKIR